jgi:hypothetical protein
MRDARVARAAACAIAALAAFACAAATATAADPGRWVLNGNTNVPLYYYQGFSSDLQANWYFDGIHVGLYRTTTGLPPNSDARSDNVIPPDVAARENYNHIGDVTWDGGEASRILLPLECYYPSPGVPRNANTCQNGAIGVADPCTLQWKYYVKLHPSVIKKVMWAEVSPDGQLLWTQAGDGASSPGGRDLIAYRISDIRPSNAAPSGPLVQPVRRLTNVVPPSGITGATFYGGRLFVAGQDDPAGFQVWSIDLNTGQRQLEIERRIIGESEGMDTLEAKGGSLHWLIAPYNEEAIPTYGIANSSVLHFHPAGTAPPNARSSQAPRCYSAAAPVPGSGAGAASLEARGTPPGSRPAGRVSPLGIRRLYVTVSRTRIAPGRRTLVFRVRVRIRGRFRAVQGARVHFAGRRHRTNARGYASFAVRFRSLGRYRATVLHAYQPFRAIYSPWVRVRANR